MSIINKIETARTRIRELQNERAELLAQPRSRAEVQAYIDALVSDWRDEAQAKHRVRLQRIASGQSPTLLFADKLGPALLLLLGADQVAKGLLAGLDAVPEGVSAAERQKRLTAIGNELDEIEQEEENLITAAEEAGERVIRRIDARPEIVMGPRPLPAVPQRSPNYMGRGEVVPKRRNWSVPTFAGRE